MAAEKLLRFLRSSGSIDAPQAAEIACQFTRREIPRQGFLLREGSVCDEYLLLEQGCLRAFACDPAGHDITTAFYQPGQVAFECSSFFTRLPSQENIQALTDCVGWGISFRQLNELFHARPEFREFGRAVLVRGFATLKARMLGMITESATERYDHLLATAPEVLLHAPVKHVATYLGITNTSLSRIRAGKGGSPA